jgi:hypothetical protein
VSISAGRKIGQWRPGSIEAGAARLVLNVDAEAGNRIASICSQNIALGLAGAARA